MNTWRSIEKDPPKLNWPVNPVYVTDGTSVYLGRFVCHEAGLLFRGVSLSSGIYVDSWCEVLELTEWQPAPGYQPEKSADEMFRDLVYEKVSKITESVYYDQENERAIRFQPGFFVRAYWKVGETWEQTGFGPAELRAVCKLLDEMGVE